MSFTFTPQEVQTIAKVAGGDVNKEHFLRAVLYLENRGFGHIVYDAVSTAGAAGPFQIMPKTWSDGLKLGYAPAGANKLRLMDAATFVANMYEREYKPTFGATNFAPMMVAYNQSPSAGKAFAKNPSRDFGAETNAYVNAYLQTFAADKRVGKLDLGDTDTVRALQITVKPHVPSLSTDGVWGPRTAEAYAVAATSSDALIGASLDRLVRSGAVQTDSDGYVVILSDGFPINVRV